jgi:glycosyltransferase involved in cell wall biosynthesis
VLTVHDAIWLREPDTVPAAVRALTTAMVRPAAHRARRVLTPSAASRDDLVRFLGLPAERIDVVPNGLAPVPGTGDRARGRALAGVPDGRPIALSVASNIAHKNLGALVEAIGVVPPEARPVAVFAGRSTHALGAGDDVRTLGAVEPGDLEDLYAAADVLVLPTRYEGFGLPVGEALARGVPVACSDIAVLREIAGDAAAYFDPRDPRSIAAAIEAVLAGGPEVERRRATGRERAARFTWEAAAQGVARAYEEAVAAR